MPKELKKIPVENQEQALATIAKLSAIYELTPPEEKRQFEVSNEHYSAYYDATEGVVKLEATHPGITEEQIKEFLMNFPPFF